MPKKRVYHLPLPTGGHWLADMPYRSKPRAVRNLMAELRGRNMVEAGTMRDLSVEEALLRAFNAGAGVRSPLRKRTNP